MKWLFYILCLFVSTGFAQKTIEKQWDGDLFTSVFIEEHTADQIKIIAKPVQTITARVLISGENSENYVITVNKDAQVLRLGTDYRPFTTKFNDKLSAHKVLSVVLEIEIPENKTIQIKANEASVYGSGFYKDIKIDLEKGSCFLNRFKGNGYIKTKGGDISIETQKGVSGKGISLKGEVYNKLYRGNKYFVEAHTITGDVHLSETK